MTAENPQWKTEVQRRFPKWGTTLALSFNEVDIPIFDITGRSVEESHDFNPANVSFRYLPFRCAPYLDDRGRIGKKTNVSAYTGLAKAVPESFGLISYLRDKINPYDEETTPEGIANTLRTVGGLPSWLVFRSDNPLQNGEVPVYIAAAAKMARGANGPFYIRQQGSRSIDIDQPTDLELTSYGEYLAYISHNKLLVSQVQTEACPADPRKIEKLAKVLFEKPTENSGMIGEQLGLSDEEIMRVAEFSAALSTSMLANIDFAIAMLANPYSAILLYLEKPLLVRSSNTGELIDAVENYLMTMNGVHSAMNHSLHRDIPQPLTRNDLAQAVASRLG